MAADEYEAKSESAEDEIASTDRTRREFIKLAGLGAGAVVAAKLLPELSEGAGTDRAGVLGKPPQPPSGTTNPYEHTVEVKINPTAANPTNPYANYPTLEIVTPNDSAYAKPALSIANGTNPTSPVTLVDKDGNLTARAIQRIVYTPYFSSLQTALDQKGVIFHPDVTRTLTAPLALKRDSTLVGADWKASVLKWTDTSSTNGINISPDPDKALYSSIRDISLVATTAKIGHAIYSPWLWQLAIGHVFISDWGNNGIVLDGTGNAIILTTVDDCEITRCNFGIVMTPWSNSINLYRDWIHEVHGSQLSGRGIGIVMTSTSTCSIIACAVENSYQGLAVCSWNSAIIGNHFEGITDSAITIGRYSRCCSTISNYVFSSGLGMVIGEYDEVGQPFPLWGSTIYDNYFKGVSMMLMRGCVSGVRAWNNIACTIDANNGDLNNTPWTFNLAPGLQNEPAYVEATYGGQNGPVTSVKSRGAEDWRNAGAVAFRTKTTAGAPDDATFGNIPGTFVWNAAENKVYVRGTDSWKYINIDGTG